MIATLAALIREHQDKTGDSYADIARRTGLSKAKIGQLAQVESDYLVRHDTCEKIARGLRIPLATVERAALGSAGYADVYYQDDSTMARVVERLRELDEATLVLVADMVETVAKHR